jgi:hypothetical protein
LDGIPVLGLLRAIYLIPTHNVTDVGQTVIVENSLVLGKNFELFQTAEMARRQKHG